MISDAEGYCLFSDKKTGKGQENCLERLTGRRNGADKRRGY